MSLNTSVSQSPSKPLSYLQETSAPNYAKLVQFLIQPFLESPDSLSVDCEIAASTGRIWLRVAFEGEDKGRVFGRGGRNIQAIKTVVAAAALLSGHSVYLDIYGSVAFNSLSDLEEGERTDVTKVRKLDPIRTKPITKPQPPSTFQ